MKAKLAPASIAAAIIFFVLSVPGTVYSYPNALNYEIGGFSKPDAAFFKVRRFFAPRFSQRHRAVRAPSRRGRPYAVRPPRGRTATANPGRWWGRNRPAGRAGPVLGAYGPTTIIGAGGVRQPLSPPSSRSSGQPPSSVAAALINGKRYRANELLIEVPNADADRLRQVLTAEYGVRIRDLGVIGLINARMWHLTLLRNRNLRQVLEQLLQDSRVIRAQPNYIYTPVQAPSPGSQPRGRPGSAPASIPATGKGVKVAIIDTCVDRRHSELDGAVRDFYDAVSPGSADCRSEDHGTAVASLIAGHGQIHGSAAAASLLSARAFTMDSNDGEVTGTSSDIVLSVDWSSRAGAQVANMSFAGPSDPLMERTLAAAYRKGIVLVAAAGNAGPSSPPLYPAAYPEVVAVTATDAKRRPYAAANTGAHIAVSARGVDVLVARAGNKYGTESGTSFAAATVSGVTALMREMRPKASPDEIRAALVNTAVTMTGGESGKTSGHGLVDASAAVAFVVANVSQ
jgi:subtilisin family serine protease